MLSIVIVSQLAEARVAETVDDDIESLLETSYHILCQKVFRVKHICNMYTEQGMSHFSATVIVNIIKHPININNLNVCLIY